MQTVTLSRDYPIGISGLLTALADADTWETMGSEATTRRREADTEVSVRTPIPASELPATLASRMPSGAELVEVYMVPEDVIGHEAEVRMTARAAGVPVEIDALITLSGRDGSTTVGVRAEVSSSVPLFGAMIEQALVPVLEKYLDQRLDGLSRQS